MITTVEELCQAVGFGLDEQGKAQEVIEDVLLYLFTQGVVADYSLDQLDFVFSEEQAY